MKRTDYRILLAAITLGGFALRLVRLDFQPLWWDEGYSMFFATRDFGTMLARTAVDIHPPLYYALLQIWMAFAGTSAVAARLLSVGIGVAAIPLIYILAIKLFAQQRVALIAALLLALSPFDIYYSQEVRMYGLVTLLCLASVYLFVQLLGMPPGKPKTAIVAVAYIVVTTAALYTQYYAALIVAFEIVTLAIYAIRSRWLIGALAHWLIAFLAIAALYLPWAIYAGGKLYAYITAKKTIEQYAPLDPITYLAQHLAAFSVGHLTDWTWLAWSSVVLVSLAAVGTAALYRRDATVAENINRTSLRSPRLSGEFCLLYLLIPLALGYLVNLLYPFHPIRNERLLLIAAPAFLILVALGARTLWARRAWLGAVTLVIVAMLCGASLYDFYAVPRYPNDDYRPLISQMQQLAQPGDAFLAIYPWQIGYLASYYAGAPLDVIETPSDAWINAPAQMQRDLDARLAQNPRVWLPALQTQGRILEDALDANLRPRTYSVIDEWFGTTRLELFQRADDPPRAAHALNMAFDGGEFSLDHWGISTDPVAAGQDIVRVWFDNGSAPLGGLKASFRLVDQNGYTWLQDDREITPGVQRIGLAIPLGAPPGDYALRLEVYRDPGVASSSESLATVRVVAPAQANLAAVPNRAAIDFGNGIRFVGYDAPTISPGIAAPVTLFWQATRALESNYSIALQVQDDRGNVYATTQAAPARGVYPTTRWQPGAIVRDPQTITLRGDAPDGAYRLAVALVDAGQTAATPRTIGAISVKGRPHYYGAPAPSHPLDARFGNLARVVGYDLENTGGNVRLILYWQALASTANSYKVFVHVVDANGSAVAFGDAIPGNGTLPTTSWVASEYLADLHAFSIPSSEPPGDYKIEFGMYDAGTGARLRVFDAANHDAGDNIQFPTQITGK